MRIQAHTALAGYFNLYIYLYTWQLQRTCIGPWVARRTAVVTGGGPGIYIKPMIAKISKQDLLSSMGDLETQLRMSPSGMT